MSFTRFEVLQKLTDEELYLELISAKKDLLHLRTKKAMHQSVKPHLFKLNKRKVAQLLTIVSERVSSN